MFSIFRRFCPLIAVIFVGVVIAITLSFFKHQQVQQVVSEPRKGWNPEQFDLVEAYFPEEGDWEIAIEQDKLVDKNRQDAIGMIDSKGNKTTPPFNVNKRKNRIHIPPPVTGYKPGEYYELIISQRIFKQRDEDIHIGFVIKKEEEESYKYRSDMMKMDKKELIDVKEDKLVLKNSHQIRNMKKDQILFVPIDDKVVDSEARKVTAVKREKNRTIVTTTKPDFIELFEYLYIYKKYTLEDNDIIFLPADGIDFEKMSASIPKLMTASPTFLPSAQASNVHEITVSGKDLRNSSMKTATNAKGLRIKLNGLDLKSVVVDGSITIHPEVTVDISLGLNDLKRFHYDYTQSTQFEIALNAKASKKREKGKSLITGKEHLGRLFIPTGVPGLFVEISLYLYLDFNGNVKVVADYMRQDQFGVVKIGSKFKTFTNNQHKIHAGLKGGAEANFRAGTGVSVGLEAAKVVGAGLRLEGGFYGDGKAVALNGTEGCYRLEAGSEGKNDFDVALARNTSLETVLYQYTLAHGKQKHFHKNTCEEVRSLIVEPPSLLLREGQHLNINAQAKIVDMMTPNEKQVEVDYPSLKHKIKDNNVITFTNGTVTAMTDPDRRETVLTLQYKGASISIPVKIVSKGEAKVNEVDTNAEEQSYYADIARQVTKVHETLMKLAEEHDWSSVSGGNKPDMEIIRSALVGKIVTKHFYEKYEDIIYNYFDQTDLVPFPMETNPEYYLYVKKESKNTLVLEVAELGDGVYDEGGIIQYTFAKENRKWLLDQLDYIGPIEELEN